MKCYFKGTLPLYHIDAYRLEHQNIELGLDEFIEGNGVCFIEWPQYIQPLLPDETLSITLKNIGGDNREITLESGSKHYDDMVKQVKGAF
jgi:Predicted ATPase or kinase